ncbi:MAG: Asp-tRNA(Asn)/Glu-tRNA(Gln) amidotransferase GatCAB subunit A [Proteobacteria bacterium]|nr:Asp-tRNA(Asn)/Glu-tRNA(Gln) amidotransferase GatCAB subunit A [Pseudomonadota bacterium]
MNEFATIGELARGLRQGDYSSVELIRHYLARIEANATLNTFITVAEDEALNAAACADQAFERGKAGPLTGIPLAHKDIFCTQGIATTCGSRILENWIAPYDATVVDRLAHAGAVLLGKTNMDEFAMGSSNENSYFGAALNPWDSSRVPGGSSGGSAAAVAAGLTPVATGTDTGGSIRLPSHFSGIAGIKPTTGRVPCTGNALPSTGLISPLSQPGPMARYVEDLSFILKIISGPDLLDPHAVDAPWHDPEQVDVTRLRIGYHTDNGISTPATEIVQTIKNVLDLLKDHNLVAHESRPGGLEMAGFIMARVFSADSGEMLNVLLEDCRTQTPSPTILRHMKRPPSELSATEFAQVLNLWQNYQSSMLGYFNDFDILISPVNAHTAIKHGEKEDMDAYTYTSAYNLTGWPATVIRAGTSETGLPIGIQILSRPFREDHCLALAAWLQSKLGTFPPPGINVFG